MALQLAFQFRGLIANNAYHRIVEVAQSRLRNANIVHVEVYVDVNAAEDRFMLLEQVTVNLPYDHSMSVADAYTALKALPEFAGAVDI